MEKWETLHVLQRIKRVEPNHIQGMQNKFILIMRMYVFIFIPNFFISIFQNHVTEIPRFQKYSRSLNSICRRPASYKNSANITIGETMLLISFGLLAKVVFDVNGYFVH